MTAAADVRTLLAKVQGQQAWAVIRRKAAPTAGIIGGTRSKVDSILDIPLEDGIPEPGRSADRLVAVPFRQIVERGFEVIDDGTPLVVVDITEEHEVGVDDLIAALPDVPVEFSDRGGFGVDDDDYATIVERIISDEIGQGEGANLVIGRHYRAVVADWDAERALTVFRRLLVRERGAYWTFIFFTGDRFLIGASPERHVSVKGGDVRMNPISGTFRVGKSSVSTRSAAGGLAAQPAEAAGGLAAQPAEAAGGLAAQPAEGAGDLAAQPAEAAGGLAAQPADDELKERLLDFLADEKEIFELFMVVDEELKMMCDICHEGGQVLGPFLKPMTHLVHTEYLLAGRSERDPREILRDTMYAATVTGAPVENACRLISTYETEGRGYYGSALALFGRDKHGSHTMDSPILIRTADVSPQGDLKVTAGATLVRDSNAAYEVAETHAKAGGILSAFGLVPVATVDSDAIAALARDEDVLLALGTRNQRLSRFWLTDQEGAPPDPTLKDKSVVILHGEDDFVNMLRHILGVFGMTSSVVRHEDYAAGAFAGADLVIVGPGPGDPRDGEHPKIAAFRTAVDDLLASGQPFLAVCLGHQTLCERLGVPLAFKDIVFQGTQSQVPYRGRSERVGFYNTFVGRVTDPGALPEGVTVERDEATGDVHLVAGPHYRGIQFHAESILTEHGYDLLHDLVQALVGNSELHR